LEEAEYGSPMWAVLRALQQINSATRIEREAVISASPFFQSAGRGDILSWGLKEGPTVMRDNVVYWKTNRKINNDLQYGSDMRQPNRTRKGMLAGRGKNNARLVVRALYYEHCSRSIVPRELKEKQKCLPLLSFSRRDEEIYFSGEKGMTNSSNMGEPIRTKERNVGWKRRA